MDTLNFQLEENQKLLDLTLAAQKCIEDKIQNKVDEILARVINGAGRTSCNLQNVYVTFNEDGSRSIDVLFNHVRCTFVIENGTIDISYSESYYGVSYSILHNIVEAIEKEKLLG